MVFRTIALAVADSQSLLSIAYSLNFWLEVCTITEYHYNIAIDCILMSLSAAVMSVLIVQDYWKTPIAAVLRTCAHLVVFIWTFVVMANQLAIQAFPEWEPSFNRHDSAILLPASCFFDRDPDAKVFKDLTPKEYKQVGGAYTPRDGSTEFNILLFNMVLYVLASLRHAAPLAYRCYTKRRGSGHQEYGLYLFFPLCLYWAICTVAVFVILIVLAHHIQVLRAWTDQSGWLERMPNGDNPEAYISGLGQLAPMLALGCIGIAVADIYKRDRKK